MALRFNGSNCTDDKKWRCGNLMLNAIFVNEP